MGLPKMQIESIACFPIKGFMGKALQSVSLKRGQGVPGDRQFAFGIDASADDGQWHPSRSYLINAVNDNLLKFELRNDQDAWVITSPSGERLRFELDNIDSLKRFNAHLNSFFDSISNSGKIPQLIERNQNVGPKGHWDFPDSELLIVNLATIRELEERLGLEIDPRRFRANLLVDGLPAWSEFGLYGSEFSVGSAKFEVLRPARRCAATSVNPVTGERDVAIQKYLAQEYGHGFFGVYARVSKTGNVSIGDDAQCTNVNALRTDEMACDIAPDATLWPKMASVESTEDSSVFLFSSTGTLPVAPPNANGRMRIHVKPKLTIVGQIIQEFADKLILQVENGAEELGLLAGGQEPASNFVLMSGPYGSK